MKSFLFVFFKPHQEKSFVKGPKLFFFPAIEPEAEAGRTLLRHKRARLKNNKKGEDFPVRQVAKHPSGRPTKKIKARFVILVF